MSTRYRFLLIVAVLVVVLGGLFGGRLFQLKQLQAQFSQPQPPTPVAATEVTETRWVPRLNSVGSLRAINGIEVANEVPGVVEEILFESGDKVERDQVLVRLDTATDEAALATLKAEAQLAESEFQRAAELLNNRAVSQAEYDAAKANMDAAGARVNQQNAQLNKKILRAPFAGVVGLRQVDLGEYLPVGSAVAEINMLSPIYVEYTVAEQQLDQIAVGHEVSVRVAAMPGQTFSGKVSAVNTSVTPTTRTVRVRGTIENPDGQLKPGMFANVRTLQPQARNLLAVPRTAISFNTYGDFAFVLVEDDEGQLVTERREVTTGEVRHGMIEIIDGLNAGERIVETGLLRLQAGQPVQISAQEKTAADTDSTPREEAAP